ncbi:DUF4169 family protein [uncultured Bartonella sp.]|uniref:DUF4169 family protein n=1 Tax=uncultured Bartonella sp. TaxID=104108 RepID=UPI0025FE63D5|nr:DUF4169 family protein [uncultured Bartonella sp.]
MADLINLRQFRKKKKRQIDESNANENRILFGRTKTERQFDEREKRKTDMFLSSRELSHDK